MRRPTARRPPSQWRRSRAKPGRSMRSVPARAALTGRSPFGELEQRLRAVEAEVADIGSELRQSAEAIADDPERLAGVRARRHLLRELTRKYGETLEEVVGVPRAGPGSTRRAGVPR